MLSEAGGGVRNISRGNVGAQRGVSREIPRLRSEWQWPMLITSMGEEWRVGSLYLPYQERRRFVNLPLVSVTVSVCGRNSSLRGAVSFRAKSRELLGEAPPSPEPPERMLRAEARAPLHSAQHDNKPAGAARLWVGPPDGPAEERRSLDDAGGQGVAAPDGVLVGAREDEARFVRGAALLERVAHDLQRDVQLPRAALSNAATASSGASKASSVNHAPNSSWTPRPDESTPGGTWCPARAR